MNVPELVRDHIAYCAQCGLPVRIEAAMETKDGELIHQGACYEQFNREAENDNDDPFEP